MVDADEYLQSSSRKELKGFMSELGLSSAGLNALGGSSSDEDDLSDSSEVVDLDLDQSNRITGTSGCGLDFNFHAFPRAFALPQIPSSSSCASVLQADCEACFTHDGSFWWNHGAAARCTLERLAKLIFEHHTRAVDLTQFGSSGAEWWVQVRDCSLQEGGIGFHWDQDEDLLDSTGISLCPQVSTITYLSDVGAPTMVLDLRSPLDCEDVSILYSKHCKFETANISYPRTLKHVAFDGQLLHGVPSELAPSVSTKHKRYSFLVNIWVGHRPHASVPLPQEMVSQLSNYKVRSHLKAARACPSRAIRPTGSRFTSEFGRDSAHNVSLKSLQGLPPAADAACSLSKGIIRVEGCKGFVSPSKQATPKPKRKRNTDGDRSKARKKSK